MVRSPNSPMSFRSLTSTPDGLTRFRNLSDRPLTHLGRRPMSILFHKPLYVLILFLYLILSIPPVYISIPDPRS